MGKAVRVWTSPDVGVNLTTMAETSAESQEPGLLRRPGSPTPAGEDPGTEAAIRRPRIFYGWYMVVCGWVSLTLGYGILFSAPLIFFESWSDTFGWGRGTISNAFSLSLLAVALASPGAGKITDKYGSQPVMLFGGVMLGVGVFLLRWISEPWELYAALMIAALGFAFSVAVPVNVLIARWFERRRSLAIAITYTGIGAGGLITIPLATAFIELYSWQTTTTILAITVLALQIPLSIFVVRRDPQSMGLRPDGDPEVSAPSEGRRARSGTPPSASLPGVALSQAAKTLKFWVIGVLFFVALCSSFGTFTQTQPFLGDLGYVPQVASALLAANGGMVIFSKFLYAYLSDKVPIKAILGTATIGAMMAPTVMFSVVFLDAPRFMGLLIPLILASAGTAFSAIVPIVAASNFGIRNVGAISGALGSFALFGMAAGPTIIGNMYELNDSYALPSGMFMVCMFGAFLMLMKGPGLGGGSGQFARRFLRRRGSGEKELGAHPGDNG